MGVGETGVGETGVGETGVGETGVGEQVLIPFPCVSHCPTYCQLLLLFCI